MPNVGGYAIVSLAGVTVNIGKDTGNAVVNNIDPVTVSKLRDLSKPVLMQDLTITTAGATIEVAGFAPHVIQAGVDKHIYGNVTVSVVGDTSLQFTVS